MTRPDPCPACGRSNPSGPWTETGTPEYAIASMILYIRLNTPGHSIINAYADQAADYIGMPRNVDPS